MGNYFDLLREFFVTDFKLRYKHSFLGFLWVIIKPFSQYAVMFTVWTALFHKTSDFASFLFIGILVMTYFSEGIIFGMQSLSNKSHIILKVNFPREIVVISSVAIATCNFLINFAIYLFLRIISQQPLLSVHWYYFILGFVLLTLLLFGFAFVSSVITIQYHDIRHLIELLLQLIFWATPVFYEMSQLPTRISLLLTYGNPLVILLANIRYGLIAGVEHPNSMLTLGATILILLFTILSFLLFKKRLPKIAEYF